MVNQYTKNNRKFTDTPNKVRMVNEYTKNNRKFTNTRTKTLNTALRRDGRLEEYSSIGPMERDERLRRRREQYRARRSRETPEERRQRLDRRNDYERRRYAALSLDQRQSLSQRRRERTLRSNRSEHHEDSTIQAPQQSTDLPSFDDPSVLTKIMQFHSDLMTLSFNQCSICKENFPNLKVSTAGICSRCHSDKHVPKLYSAENNMDPGPVPSQLTVCLL